MTTTGKAASNGSPAAAAAPERISGIARVKEAEAYHISSVAHGAAFEAERLCHAVYRAASDAYLRDSATSEAASALADPAMQDTIREAVYCLVAAVDGLCSLMSEPLT
jgi:hypothetical protein